MRRIRHVLVAIKDPMAATLPAAAKAAQLARALSADLTLFQAMSSPPSGGEEIPPRHWVGVSENYIRSAHEACLRAIALRLRRGALRVSVSAQWGHPADVAILREAARIGADLIVVDAQQLGDPGSTIMRLTDWGQLCRSPVPLLLIKNPAPYQRPRVLAALDPDHTFDKPLSLDAEIVSLGSTISESLDGVLHAVHAYAPVPVEDPARGVVPAADAAAAQSQAEKIAAKKLALATRGLGIPKSRRHILGRHVPDAIEQVARETKSAIVVMGCVARSGLSQVLIGNTAERVLDQLHSDILLVKPPVDSKGARATTLPLTAPANRQYVAPGRPPGSARG